MKKLLKKVSKKSILIASILIVLIGVPVLAYLFTREQTEDTSAWYNSNWLYRKMLQIDSPGAGSNVDILITLDTSSLISSGKLQSNCNDIRFVLPNDSTIVAYWIEGGCNTSNTQVWIRMTSISAGLNAIYFYYGNPSAPAGQTTWSGTFTMLASAACPSGWTRNTDFDSYFPYGATSYGGTGGSAAAHNHGGSASCTTGGPSANGSAGCAGGGGASANNHTHTGAGATLNNTTVLPSYINTIFCSRADLNIPTGLIGIFDTSAPSGWTRFTALDNRLPRGASSYGATGGSDTHTHTTATGVVTGSSGAFGVNYGTSGSSLFANSNHTHTTNSATASTPNHLPPYINVVFASSNGATVAPSGIVLLTNVLPPYGWTRFTPLDNRFPRGASSYGTTGGAATHTHTISIGTGGPSSTQERDGGCTSVASSTHTHSCTATSSAQSNLPPYRNTLFVKRNTSNYNLQLGSEEMSNTTPTAPTSLLTEGAINPSRVTDLTPEFSAIFNDADTGDTAVFYQIQVNTNSSFTGTVMWDSGRTAISPIARGARSPDISYNGTPLSLSGDTYYWRIKFWDQVNFNSESPWSATAAFTMNRAPTAPTDPLTEGAVNPIKVYDTTPEFSAVFNDPDTGDTGIHYQIQVSTVSNFTSTVWDSNQTSISAISNGARSPDISYGGTPLALDGTLYYWRIKFWDQAGTESSWSSTATFRMSANPYAPIELKVDGRTNPPLIDSARPTFYATHRDANEDNAIFVEINVNSNASFTGTIKWNTGKVSIDPVVHGAEYTVTYGGTQLLGDSTTYYWRIRFWDVDDNVSPWSATASFVDLFKYTRMNGIGMDGLQIN